MILFNVVALHIPTVVFIFGSNSPQGKSWVGRFNVMERIQLVGFCIQEFIISTIYVWGTTKLLRSIYHSMTRTVMTQLIIINCICVSMDIILISLEFTDQYISEAAVKPMMYAIKLKLEFAVLTQLMGLTKAAFTEGSRWIGGASNEPKDQSDHAHAFNDLNQPRPTKVGLWTCTNALSRESSSSPMDLHPVDRGRGIFKTQHIEVISEAGPENSTAGHDPSPPTAVAFSDQGILSRNLMGTTQINIPPRKAGSSHHDPRTGRRSPSESEMAIVRTSSDHEKDTT